MNWLEAIPKPQKVQQIRFSKWVLGGFLSVAKIKLFASAPGGVKGMAATINIELAARLEEIARLLDEQGE